eukprot:scaffold9045_cov78-Skeletonema_dohrnii-CCMP3373.AAC.2
MAKRTPKEKTVRPEMFLYKLVVRNKAYPLLVALFYAAVKVWLYNDYVVVLYTYFWGTLIGYLAMLFLKSLQWRQSGNNVDKNKMSTDGLEAANIICCASCGIAELNDNKLKECPTCDLVRYCSVKCQREHRRHHKKAACKERAAELWDEILFKQPESSHVGDCPICCLPLSLDNEKSPVFSCCITTVCMGCVLANRKREKQNKLQHACPFCRRPMAKTQKDSETNYIKRAAVNDPRALVQVGIYHNKRGDHQSAVEHFAKAAALNSVEAHHMLSVSYRNGIGVEKDKKQEVYHLEQAAIGGHPLSRCHLGCVEEGNGRLDRAVKHWIIAANLGDDDSIKALKNCYELEVVSKENYASALRGYQAAIDATKSPQREAADKAEEARKLCRCNACKLNRRRLERKFAEGGSCAEEAKNHQPEAGGLAQLRHRSKAGRRNRNRSRR